MNKNPTLSEFQQMIRKFCDDRKWDQFHNPKDLAISLSLESAELLEHFQWKNDKDIAKHLTKNSESVADELADVLYWTLLIANKLEIDLDEAFINKMQKNEMKYPIDKSIGNSKKYTEL